MGKLKMKIMHDDLFSKTWYVDLLCGDQSINQLLAAEGYVLQEREHYLPYCFKEKMEYQKEWAKEHVEYVDKYFAEVKTNIAAAKADHKNIFRYGDVEQDEEDNLYRARPQPLNTTTTLKVEEGRCCISD